MAILETRSKRTKVSSWDAGNYPDSRWIPSVLSKSDCLTGCMRYSKTKRRLCSRTRGKPGLVARYAQHSERTESIVVVGSFAPLQLEAQTRVPCKHLERSVGGEGWRIRRVRETIG